MAFEQENNSLDKNAAKATRKTIGENKNKSDCFVRFFLMILACFTKSYVRAHDKTEKKKQNVEP